MRIALMLVIGSGVVLLLVGLTITAIGGSMVEDIPPDSEDWSGTLMYQGVTPNSYEDRFEWESYYNVWISEEADASNLKIEVIETGTTLNPGYFVPCEELGDCNIFDIDGKIPYYKYIGEIQVEQTGTYQVNFNIISGYDFEVMVREDSSFLGILGSIGGTAVCCGGFVLIIIGLILAVVSGDKSKSTTQLYHVVDNEDNSVNLIDNSFQDSNNVTKQEDASNWWESKSEK